MTRDEVTAFIKQTQYGFLATVGADNAPHVRPVAVDDIYGDDLYFFTFSTTRKVAELDQNSRVEIAWCKPEEVSQVRITGEAVVVDDADIEERFKKDNPIVSQLLPAEAAHLFRLYRVRPEKVYMAKGLVPYTEVDW